jgi:hypothetical protein
MRRQPLKTLRDYVAAENFSGLGCDRHAGLFFYKDRDIDTCAMGMWEEF